MLILIFLQVRAFWIFGVLIIKYFNNKIFNINKVFRYLNI